MTKFLFFLLFSDSQLHCFNLLAGGSGYKCLLDLGFPLPAIRTLQQRTEEIKFEPGVVTEVFDLLKLKACQMSSTEVLCSLVMDEMSITPGSQWDVKSDSFIGSVTLGDVASGTKATKCLAFLLAGIAVRWKQVVYYHFTGKIIFSRNLICIWSLITEVKHLELNQFSVGCYFLESVF